MLVQSKVKFAPLVPYAMVCHAILHIHKYKEHNWHVKGPAYANAQGLSLTVPSKTCIDRFRSKAFNV